MTYPWAHLAEAARERFMSFVEFDPNGGCYLWRGATSRGGKRRRNSKRNSQKTYASFRIGRWTVRAQIFAAVLDGEGVPGMHRDHRCGVHLCVRFGEGHIEETTPSFNSARRWDGRRRCDQIKDTDETADVPDRMVG